MRPIDLRSDCPILPRRTGAAGTGLPAARGEFEALLGTSPGSSALAGERSPAAERGLRDRFAQVFDAFGFFGEPGRAAMQGEAGSPPAPDAPSDEPAAAPANSAALLAAQIVQASNLATDFEISGTATPVGSEAAPGPAAGSKASQDRASVTTGDLGLGPLPEPASFGRDEVAVAAARGTRSSGPSVKARAMVPSDSPADQFTMKLNGQVVELSARLRNLGQDEEGRLMNALESMLEGHGLSLGTVLVNGRPLRSARPGEQR